jgi:oligo-1,6-glucosidase
MDSNGDGIGDLPGITSKLDYLKSLGVNVVWLSPHFDSPNADNGYDIRDYRKVMTEFGTMVDFDRMLDGMRKRNIRLIIDLVVNHTSDEHHWFVESRKSTDNPYRDYYIWRDGKDGGPPNNYPSIFGGSAWKKDGATGQYYLHCFAEKQPDLNWENPKVRAEVYDLMRFWLDKGVSGFRMDVIPFISKQPGLPDMTPEQLRQPQDIYASGPKVHEYLQEMNREVLHRYDVMTVGEAFGVTIAGAHLLTDDRRNELNMVFTFDIVGLDRASGTRDPMLPRLKALYTKIDREASEHGWNTAYLSNHDQPRTVSHFGDDDPAWMARSAKTLATMLLTQRATPFIYQGEEIGMTNYPFAGIEDFDDIAARNQWRDQVLSGKVPAATLLAELWRKSRDNARTPMQWAADTHGGFTSGKPWLKVNPNTARLNVAAQSSDPNSVLAHFRRLIALRKRTPALIYGRYRDLDPDHKTIFAYTRTLQRESFLILLNFSRDPIDYVVPTGLSISGLRLSSEQAASARKGAKSIRLHGWESAVFALQLDLNG